MRCLFFVLTVVLVPIYAFGDWDVETPCADTSGMSAAIVVDSDNNPHILYFVSDYYFYHIYKSGGVWYGPYPIAEVNYWTLCRMVDVAMVRDTVNAIMSLEYTGTGDYVLWGKHVGGGTWATEQVPNTLAPTNAGGYLNVAISPGAGSTSFHVIYVHYNYGNSILYHRKYDSTWTNADTVSFVPDVSSGWQHDVAVDANDDPHVTFLVSDEGIKYRKKTGGAWEPVELVSAATDPSFTAIAIDASNDPHLAYDKDDFGAVCYRAKTTTGWQPEETIGAGGGWNTYGASIAVVGGDKFVAYYAEGDLKFAMSTTGGWVSEDVDTAGDVGTHTSLAIDNDGYAHIAYRDADNERLKYAKSTEPVVGIAESEWNADAEFRRLAIHAYPNPFNHSTDIRCQIPDDRSELELTIFDAAGRLIADLGGQISIAGEQLSAKWDGTDCNGRLMGSGVYFVRCRSNSGDYISGRAVIEKIVILR
jgi:hypothetical protein